MGWASYREDIVSRFGDGSRSSKSKMLVFQGSVGDGGKPAGSAKKPGAKAGQGTAPKAGQDPAPKKKSMTELSKFAMTSARPLPVIVLADVSGSMAANGKIDILNEAVCEMIATFAEEEDARAEIHVAVITFGADGARLHKPLKPAAEVTWQRMAASGRTPMGGAFAIAQQMIEDRTVIPGRAYRPTIVLVSDGVPTDDWKAPLASLLASERAAKAARFAMGIGDDADRGTLQAFLAGLEGRVFEAHEAREIRKFFRWVTMSVTSRSRSANPNNIVAVEPTALDDFEF